MIVARKKTGKKTIHAQTNKQIVIVILKQQKTITTTTTTEINSIFNDYLLDSNY